MMWVIQNVLTREYVGNPSRKNAYTHFLQNAQRFASQEEAQRIATGNERVLSIAEAME